MQFNEPVVPRGRRRFPQPPPPSLDPESAQVLDAAVRLFWRHGYRQTTTRDIESLAGISLSRIYCLFGSKERLLASALLRYAELLKRELVGPLEGSRLGLEAISEFFDRLGHWVTHEGRPGCMLINMMAEPGSPGTCIGEHAGSMNQRLTAAFESALQRAEAQGEVSAGDPSVRAQVLSTSVLGVNLAARGGAMDNELARMVSAIKSQVESWRAQ